MSHDLSREDADRAKVMLHLGRTVDEVAAEFAIGRAAVLELGWKFGFRFEQHTDTMSLKALPTPKPEPTDRNLVVVGMNSTVPKVRRAAEKVVVAAKNHQVLLAELRAVLREGLPVRRDSCGTWSGYQAHRKHGENACEDCAEACRAREASRRAGHLSEAGQIRAWAKANNILCPARGRIPDYVLAAHNNATQNTGEPA
jgi:hypothetical protein